MSFMRSSVMNVSIDVGTSEWYKAHFRGSDKPLILLVEEPWTDNPFLGTIPLLNHWFERK
jgi:hypothetical protein